MRERERGGGSNNRGEERRKGRMATGRNRETKGTLPRGHGRGQGGPQGQTRVQHATTRYRHLPPSINPLVPSCFIGRRNPTPNSLAPRYSPIRRRFCMNRHHDRSVDRSWHRVRGTKSKAKPVTPGSRAEPTSDTSCPPRGPHHFVLASFSFLVSLFEPLLSSFSPLSYFIFFLHLFSPKVSSIPLFLPYTPPSLYASFFVPPSSRFFPTVHSPSCSLLPPVLLAARSPANRSRPPRVCPRRADLPLRRLPGVAARAHEVPSAWRRSRKTQEKRYHWSAGDWQRAS